MNKPTLTCWGGVSAVTGANFLLETGNKKYLIDCGLAQGMDKEERNDFEYDPALIDTLFITHAHIDHIGRIPDLVKKGFRGVIYSTNETMEIADEMLKDLLHIANRDEKEAEAAMRLWKPLGYHEPKDFGEFTLELCDAGHILGSAMYKFVFKSGKSMLFTGDLGNSPSPLLRDTEKVEGLSYLLMESVYGDRNHESKDERDAKFTNLVERVISKKGTLIIPVFSLERTQVILYELHKLYEAGRLKGASVFLDSPLAIRITEIYKRLTGKDVFDFPMLHETSEARDSIAIAEAKTPKIILAGSGMSTAGRILFHEERYLPDANSTILFVGYQTPGTTGRQIQEGVKEVEINGNRVRVNAKVESIEGFSAHAGSDQLVDFVSNSKDTLKEVFIAMGEPKSSIFLAQRLKDELEVEAIIPKRGKPYTLDL